MDSLRPVQQQADGDLFWILRTIASMLVGREWDCQIHHPFAPETSLPPELGHIADARVCLSGTGPATGTGTQPGGERALD